MIVCSASESSDAFAAQRDFCGLAFEAAGFDLRLQADEVVDEDDVVDQHVGQLDIAGWRVAAEADGEQWHALSASVFGGVGERRRLRS